MISGETVEVTGVVDRRRRSVELHLIPVVHVPHLTPGHILAASHVPVQRVDLVQGLNPRADLSLAPGQKVVHALAVDPTLGQDQRVSHGQDQEVSHVLGVAQDQQRAHHDPGLDQRVGLGVVDHPVPGPGK